MSTHDALARYQGRALLAAAFLMLVAALLQLVARLPYLLRRRPTVRQLNCSTASYYASTTDEDREIAERQLQDEYATATWPVRVTYDAGQLIGRAWREVHFHAGIALDWARDLDKERTP